MSKLLVFTADWCGPCKAYKTTLNAIRDELPVDMEIIDVESESGAKLAAELSVRGVPTTIYKGPTGNYSIPKVGAISGSQLQEYVASAAVC